MGSTRPGPSLCLLPLFSFFPEPGAHTYCGGCGWAPSGSCLQTSRPSLDRLCGAGREPPSVPRLRTGVSPGRTQPLAPTQAPPPRFPQQRLPLRVRRREGLLPRLPAPSTFWTAAAGQPRPVCAGAVNRIKGTRRLREGEVLTEEEEGGVVVGG